MNNITQAYECSLSSSKLDYPIAATDLTCDHISCWIVIEVSKALIFIDYASSVILEQFVMLNGQGF